MSRPLPRGVGEDGLVHYDSEAKQTYIWPMCSTPHLTIKRAPRDRPITCIGCIDALARYYPDYGGD